MKNFIKNIFFSLLVLGILNSSSTYAQRPRTTNNTSTVQTSTNSTISTTTRSGGQGKISIRSGGVGKVSGESYIRKIIIASNSIASINGLYARNLVNEPFIKSDNTNLVIDYDFVNKKWYLSSTNVMLYSSQDLLNWTNEAGTWGNSTSSLFYK